MHHFLVMCLWCSMITICSVLLIFFNNFLLCIPNVFQSHLIVCSWCSSTFLCYVFLMFVITLPLEEWEDDIHTFEMGTWESIGTPKTLKFNCRGQNTLHWSFFCIIEKISKFKSKMGLHEPFGHLQHKLWQKERPGVKLAIWLPTTKSQESTQPWCVQVECNTPLERSRRKLQVCFIPHPNQRSEQKVITPQSGESPNQNSFGTPPWESQDKKPFGCRCCREVQRILYGGRWWPPPNLGRGEFCESKVACGLS